MAVELFIEAPKGHRTEDRQFQPGEQVRIAGRVTYAWGIPASLAAVDIHIRDAAGRTVQSVRTSTTPVGTFWWDVALPTATGPYSVFADAFGRGNASLAIEITRAAVHTSFELGVDPKEPFVGGDVKLTARILANGAPVVGTSVVFAWTTPAGAAYSAIRTTSTQGAAVVAFLVGMPGIHTVSAKAPDVGGYVSQQFTASSPPEPVTPPQPTPVPPDGEPQPTPPDWTSLIAMIMPILLMSLMVSMMGEKK